MSPPPTVTVLLAALWVSSGRCRLSESPGPGCDNGKLSLDRDLPADAVPRDCQWSVGPESARRLPSVDTVYAPVPARQICMDKSISCNHTIPNSGAYRPVRAESGEYLYCPPQRWLNNLHHGATVLLYHPCAPLHERLLLSVLARSCLPDYIVTSHPQLNELMPIAFVSWGRTLELTTVASSDLCDWLESTASTRSMFGGAGQSGKYNLLLTRSAEQHGRPHAHPEEHSAKMKESLRRCCVQTISGAIEAEPESNVKKESSERIEEVDKHRWIRAAVRDKQEERENAITPQTNRTTIVGKGEIQNTTLGSNMSENTLQSDSSGFRAPESQKSRLVLQTAAQETGPKHADLRNPNPSVRLDGLASGVNSERNDTARPEDVALGSKDEGTRDKDSVKHSLEDNVSKDNTAGGSVKDNEVVDVQERELEHKRTLSDAHHKGEDIGFDSKSESLPPPRQHQVPQPASYLPNSRDCDSCKAGEHCECNEDAGASAAVVNKGLLRTPRTDEAVWAAAALGFLLILLTLSVLHTRLYRNWRTTPSLYWHDPQRDYDSVADVIRRRLRIANRRRKRGRRQECVLLPSSSSSDEHP